MMLLISPSHYGEFVTELAEMHPVPPSRVQTTSWMGCPGQRRHGSRRVRRPWARTFATSLERWSRGAFGFCRQLVQRCLGIPFQFLKAAASLLTFLTWGTCCGNIRALRSHNRVRPFSSTERNRYRDRCPHGTYPSTRRIASSHHWEASTTRKYDGTGRLSGGLNRCLGARPNRRAYLGSYALGPSRASSSLGVCSQLHKRVAIARWLVSRSRPK